MKCPKCNGLLEKVRVPFSHIIFELLKEDDWYYRCIMCGDYYYRDFPEWRFKHEVSKMWK